MIDSQPPKKAPCLSFLDPTALTGAITLFLHLAFGQVSEKLLLCFSEEPPLGFGYPLGDISKHTLGSLFQLPALMGFTLQSFALSRAIPSFFRMKDPFLLFITKPLGFAMELQRVAFPRSRSPFFAPQRVRLGRGRYSLELLGLSGSPTGSIHLKVISTFKFPFHP